MSQTPVLLDHSQISYATKIHEVFQLAYRVEADLIGVEDIPPLHRSASAIQASDTLFYAIIEAGQVAAVVEIDIQDQVLDICSLVVAPAFFRRGLASQLMAFLQTSFTLKIMVVETGAGNAPAIALYEKFGFVLQKQWTPGHGIPKVLLELQC